jgi:hypothetical protein
MIYSEVLEISEEEKTKDDYAKVLEVWLTLYRQSGSDTLCFGVQDNTYPYLCVTLPGFRHRRSRFVMKSSRWISKYAR